MDGFQYVLQAMCFSRAVFREFRDVLQAMHFSRPSRAIYATLVAMSSMFFLYTCSMMDGCI
jgi:hypothetical protein